MSKFDVGWPMPQGGTQQIANTLVRSLESLGGHVETGVPQLHHRGAVCMVCVASLQLKRF